METPRYRKPNWYKHLLGDAPLQMAADIGFDKGETAETLARAFNAVHVFDVDDRAMSVKRQLVWRGVWQLQRYGKIIVEGSSHKLGDSCR